MPDWRDHLRARLAALGLAPEREAEIVEELSQHAEDRYAELLAEGRGEDEALRTTLDELTGQELLAAGLGGVERTRVPEPVALGVRLTGIGQDLRYGLRSLRKSPGFAVVAMLTLALGIGANTAIFSVVNGVLLRPLPYGAPERLVRIYESTPEFSRSSVSYLNYLDWRRDNRSFAEMGAYRREDFNFTGAGDPEQVTGLHVTASLLPTLGVHPELGRGFLPQDDRTGAGCTVMLSHGFWQRRFAADARVLGRVLRLNTLSCTVIGVLPRGFQLASGAGVFVPIETWQSAELRSRQMRPGLRAVARLKPGVTLAAAQAELSSLCAQLARTYPGTNSGIGGKLVGMMDDVVGSIRPTLLLLVGAVGFVLIIACANVANLLLARAAARRREFAIRTALGAERGRMIRQLLTESVLLSVGGAAIGLVLAEWGTRAVLAATPESLPRAEQVGLDPWVLLFTVALSLVTGLLFGLAPALQSSKTNPQEFLKEGTRGSGGGRHRTESVFVVVEIGLAMILLVGAGLMVQSVWRLWQVNPGFNPDHLLTTHLAVSPKAAMTPQGIRLAFEELLRRAQAIPGVEAAAVTSLLPMESDSEIPFWRGTGPQPPTDQLSSSMFYITTPDYPKAMEIPLRRGRFLDARDGLHAAPVIVVDDVLAERVFPGEDPVGRQISLMAVGPVTIVGVVGHVKHWGLDSDDTSKVRAQIYFPFTQVPDQFMSGAVAGINLVLRTGPEPLTLVPVVRAEVAGPARDQPIYGVRTMEQIIEDSLAERRFTMLVLLIFSGTALLLAAVGIYGVMSYAVTRRTHELGIRASLGATRGAILRLILREGMKLAFTGTAAGLAAALLLTRFLAGLLYGVRPADPVTLIGVALLLGSIALLACYVPARRATAVDPVIALRCE